MNNSVVFSAFVMSHNHHLYLVPEHFNHSKRKSYTNLVVAPIPSFPLSTNLLSISVYLPILGISHKCNHAICDLLCLTSYIRHNVFKANLCCTFSSFLFYYFSGTPIVQILEFLFLSSISLFYFLFLL